MALSEDTAALVAAQLTVALYSNLPTANLREHYSKADAEAAVLKTYLRYRDACRETKLGGV